MTPIVPEVNLSAQCLMNTYNGMRWVAPELKYDGTSRNACTALRCSITVIRRAAKSGLLTLAATFLVVFMVVRNPSGSYRWLGSFGRKIVSKPRSGM